jgi:hypothetical protein
VLTVTFIEYPAVIIRKVNTYKFGNADLMNVIYIYIYISVLMELAQIALVQMESVPLVLVQRALEQMASVWAESVQIVTENIQEFLIPLCTSALRILKKK